MKKEPTKAMRRKMDLRRKIEYLYSDVRTEGRCIDLTEFSPSSDWREHLSALEPVGVCDRDAVIGILLSPELYKAVLAYIELIDDELEEERLWALYQQRKDTTEFHSGEELRRGALAELDKQEKQCSRTDADKDE